MDLKMLDLFYDLSFIGFMLIYFVATLVASVDFSWS